MIIERAGERRIGAVVARPREAARILIVASSGFGTPVRVEPDLVNIPKRAHQRTGETGEVANRLQRNRDRDGGFHH